MSSKKTFPEKTEITKDGGYMFGTSEGTMLKEPYKRRIKS